MTRSHRFRWAAAGALVWLVTSAPLAHAQSWWSMSEAACNSTNRRNDDASWPPTLSSWEGLGVSTGHDVSGDAWAGECFEVTLCRPRIMHFQLRDIDHRPGHNFELWMDGHLIGATPKYGKWGQLVCKYGHWMPLESNGDWMIGFGRDGPGVNVLLPHTEGQVHQIRIRFGGYDGHDWLEVFDSCMVFPNCQIRWDWMTPKVVAKGRLTYRDSTISAFTPVRSVKVALYDVDADGSRDYLGVQTTTDAQGNFTFPCIDNVDEDEGGGPLDLQVRAFIQSDSSGFAQPSPPAIKPLTMLDGNNAIWSFDSPIKWDCAGIDSTHWVVDFGTYKPADNDYAHNSMLHIYTVLLRGWDWVAGRVNSQNPGEVMGETRVHWAPNLLLSTSSIASGTGGDIWINGRPDHNTFSPDEWDDQVLLHEYGHLVAGRYAFSDPPSHGLAHYLDAEDDGANGQPLPGLAWEEGWAHFFGCMTQAAGGSRYLYNFGWDADGSNKNRARYNMEDGWFWVERPINTILQGSQRQYNSQGMNWELPVSGTLWDIFDSASDNQSDKPCGESYGESSAHTQILAACRAMSSPVPLGVLRFYDMYKAQNPTIVTALRDVFCEHGIDVSQRAPQQVAVSDAAPGAAPIAFVDRLVQSQPNPFRLATRIDFEVARGGPVRLAVFDLRGRLVRDLAVNQTFDPGPHSLSWDRRGQDGTLVPSGVYFYQLATDRFLGRKKLIVLP